MLKRILVILLILIISGVIFAASFLIARKYILERFLTEDSIIDVSSEDNDNFTIYNNTEDGVRVALSKLEPEIIYNPEQEIIVRDIAKDNVFDIVINGGYFNTDNEYAGALIIDGKIISRPAPLDQQLSHVVTYNSNNKTYEFKKTTEFQSSTQYDLAFQTGPLFLLDNNLQSEFINNSANGTGEYLRSFLGTTSEGEVFVGITLKKYSLEDLADYLLELDIFKNKTINVINLDGGSSVSLYLGENSKFNYGQYKILPILIGFK